MSAGRRTRAYRLASLALVGAAALASGCKLFDRGGGGGGGSAPRPIDDRPDPLLGSRIPATDLPVPNREGYGKGKPDPLLGSPAGRGGERSSRASDREPFRPGPAETAAGLAGRLSSEDTGLSIGDRREPGSPAGRGGPVPLRPTDGGASYAQVTEALAKFKATWAEPAKVNGEYVFRADVPVEGNADGAVRRYEGAGPTAAAAAKQVLDQLKSDRGLD